MESLVYQYDISDNHFVEREAFIKLWKIGPFDLYYFDKRDQKKMASRIEHLHKQLETKDLPKHDDIVKAIRDGEITEEVFQEYGAIIALQWVMGREEYARDEQEAVDFENKLNQSEIDLAEADRQVAEAEEEMKRLAAATEDEMEEEVADDFDPFPGEYHLGLSWVQWDDIDGIVLPLMLPVDAALPHPKKVREKDRPKADEGTFYVTKEHVFQGIFKITEGVNTELGEGMATLTYMMNTKLT
jgi:hypothetical protein